MTRKWLLPGIPPTDYTKLALDTLAEAEALPLTQQLAAAKVNPILLQTSLTEAFVDQITITLTREEAVALVMLREAAVVGGEEDYVFRNIKAVAENLTDIDSSLSEEQFEKWRDIGEPDFDLSNTSSVGFEV